MTRQPRPSGPPPGRYENAGRISSRGARVLQPSGASVPGSATTAPGASSRQDTHAPRARQTKRTGGLTHRREGRTTGSRGAVIIVDPPDGIGSGRILRTGTLESV